MKVIRRRPGIGYIDTLFWVPKDKINVEGVKNALTFQFFEKKSVQFLTLWRETTNHLLVPREFWDTTAEGITFPIIDCRPSSFPTVDFPPLPGGMVWQIFYNPTSIVLKTINDLDGDGISNLVDCAPADPSAWSIPGEISGVNFGTNNQTISWTSQASLSGPGTTYDLMRGLVGQPIGGGAAETCLALDSGSNTFNDTATPAVGTSFYYLVRGGNICGTGNYGTTTSGAPRNTAACP